MARAVHAVAGVTRRRARSIVVLSLLVAAESVAADPARTVTVAAGARYRAGAPYGLLFGAHWRDAWTTPIEVPVLDLETFDGGLRPGREGGGKPSRWHAGYGGGIWLGMFASSIEFDFATSLKATVVHSEEGTSFYLASAFAL